VTPQRCARVLFITPALVWLVLLWNWRRLVATGTGWGWLRFFTVSCGAGGRDRSVSLGEEVRE
jgi:hypothetical protein